MSLNACIPCQLPFEPLDIVASTMRRVALRKYIEFPEPDAREMQKRICDTRTHASSRTPTKLSSDIQNLARLLPPSLREEFGLTHDILSKIPTTLEAARRLLDILGHLVVKVLIAWASREWPRDELIKLEEFISFRAHQISQGVLTTNEMARLASDMTKHIPSGLQGILADFTGSNNIASHRNNIGLRRDAVRLLATLGEVVAQAKLAWAGFHGNGLDSMAMRSSIIMAPRASPSRTSSSAPAPEGGASKIPLWLSRRSRKCYTL